MTMAETNGGDRFHARHIDGNNYDPLEDNEANIDMSSTLLRATAVPPPNITVEDSLSMELMKLSMNDRQAMEEEVHGVYCMCTADETPEYLSEKLRDFDIALNEFRNSEKRLRKMERIRLQREANDCKEGRDPNTNYEEDFDVLRNVIRITDDMKMVDEEESTKCTMETTASRSSLCSITTDFPDDLGGDEKEARKKSCWVNDPDVRLRFLRSELFDAERAVMRFVVFLDFAQELYGDFIADRPMRLSDINTWEEKRVMARIQFRILPFRDRSGRRVFVSVGTCGYDVEPSLRIKILWYMFWIASEDIETQRKGLVIVGWPCNEIISGDSGNIPMSEDDTKCCDGEGGNTSAWEHSLRPGIANIEGVYQVKAIDGLPIRIAALHFCLQNRPVYRILNALFFFALNSSYKSRYKVHIGKIF